MKYTKYMQTYDNIVLKGKLRKYTREYTEMHHIKMKSLGGTNKKSNLVRLTAREHYICHILLYKHYCKVGTEKEILKSALAVSFFNKNNNSLHPRSKVGKFISKEYESVKKTISDNMKTNNPSTMSKNKGKTLVEIYGKEKAALKIEKGRQSRGLMYDKKYYFIHSIYGTVFTTIYDLQYMHNKPPLAKLTRLVNSDKIFTTYGWSIEGKVRPPEKKKQITLNKDIKLYSLNKGLVFSGKVKDYLTKSDSIPYDKLVAILRKSSSLKTHNGIMLFETYNKKVTNGKNKEKNYCN